MGKRRNTAKTGDKALYNSREQLGSKKKDNSNDDDPMYDEIDQFHNDKNKEFLRLDGGDQSDEDDDDEDRDDGISRQEAIMDLGATMDDDDDESSSSEDDSDPSNKQDDDEDEVSLSSDDSSVGETRKEHQMGDPRNWGKKKGAYYHGDTADLEIGQNEEDAFLEEEAAKEVQAARLKEMREDDFMLSGDEDEQEEDVDRNASSDKKKKKKKGKSDSKLDDTTARESLTAARDLSKLTMKAKRKLLRTQHPELLPITSYFGDIVKDLKDNTRVATKSLMEGEEGTAEAVGATRSGQEYLLTKALLQSSMALNVTMYLMLKGEEQQQMEGASSKDFAMGDNGTTSMIQGHPVMARLEQWNSMSQKLEDRIENKVEGLPDQIRNLVKAAALMKSEQDDSDDDGSSSEGEEAEEHPQSSTHQVNDSDENKQAESETPDSSSSDEESNDEEEVSRQVMNEAKFGLRPNEVQTSRKKKSGKKRRNNLSLEDFGDHDVDDPIKISKSFASSINAIEQRSKTRNRRAAPMAEQLDEPDEDDQLRRGLQMMEEELGRLEGGGDEDDEGGMDFEGESDKEIDDELEGDEFYTKIASRSKAKKAYKKSLYKVAPKFPSIDMEVQGERAISQTIQKNRGLVPHKAKINRNPRVKKREQYRKALIRRRGAVREIRTEEGHKYGGETTGIKSGLSRSRKL